MLSKRKPLGFFNGKCKADGSSDIRGTTYMNILIVRFDDVFADRQLEFLVLLKINCASPDEGFGKSVIAAFVLSDS